METAEQIFQKQYNAAQYIQKIKQKEWLEKSKQHIPIYAAEYLFYKNASVLADMLKINPETGFTYDPETLYDGIEMLFKILDNKNSKAVNKSRLQTQYLGFATPEIRISYLKTFAEYFELYPIIGEQVIQDLEAVAKTSTDPEFFELLEGRIKSIRHMSKTQSGDSGYQPE